MIYLECAPMPRVERVGGGLKVYVLDLTRDNVG